MKSLEDITDPTYTPKTHSPTDRFFLQFIRDERDLPFVYLTLKVSVTIIPLAVILYLPGITGWWWIGAAVLYHVFNTILFKGPFGLMLHCTSHRPFFKKKYGFLNHYLPWVLAPLFGHSPETYFTHHIGMHHPENNLEEDESSTMPYQRDSAVDFAKYFGSFFFLGMFQLSAYFIRKNRKKLLLKTVRGEVLFILFCIGMSLINWKATLVVFILPFIIFRLIAMVGNWTQHAFVDASDPGNPYKNSITCINVKYNHNCWNDGYHISHHQRPSMHWTDHPNHFKKHLQEYSDNDAIVFDGADFGKVFFWLITDRYDLLAAHFVNLGDRYQSDEEVIAMMKSRVKRIKSLAFS